MHAMLLCAGLGTRLRPLTDRRPKPLVPVLGRPLASFALERLAIVGVQSVVANTHHLAEQIAPGLAPWAQGAGMAFDVIHEPTLLGTGGGIRNALPRLGRDPFIVFNGDVLAAPDLAGALMLHGATSAKMTMILRAHPGHAGVGVVDVDADARVVRVFEEGPAPPLDSERCMFTGIYVIDPAIAPDLPENGCIVRHTLRRLLARGDTVAGFVDRGLWHDVGTIVSYLDVNFGLLDGTIEFPGTEKPVDLKLVSASAEMARGVEVGPYTIVGAGARVDGVGKLERVIVWDGARVSLPSPSVDGRDGVVYV